MKKTMSLALAIIIAMTVLAVPAFAVAYEPVVCYGFDETPTDWIFRDADGDGYNFMYSSVLPLTDISHLGQTKTDIGFIGSASFINYIGALDVDNWAISPLTKIPESPSKFTFMAVAFEYDDTVRVYISTTTDFSGEETCISGSGDVAIPKTPKSPDSLGPYYGKLEFDIPDEYLGQSVYFAIRHCNCTDNYWIFIDDVCVEKAFPFGVIESGETDETGYASLQEAVDSVNDDGMVFAYESDTAIVSGEKEFQLVPEEGVIVTVTARDGYKMYIDDEETESYTSEGGNGEIMVRVEKSQTRERKDSDPVEIRIPLKEETAEEENPVTGAPVFFLPAAAVMAAAFISGKRK